MAVVGGTNGLGSRVEASWRRYGVRLGRLAGPALSIAILAGALLELHRLDWRAVLATVPGRPAFWLAFAAWYLTPVIADWLIYRRLWAMSWRGLAAMLRKLVGNDLIVSYVGETYLCSLARREGGLAMADAFGAIKDVAILSAVAGNLVTLVVAAAALPLTGALLPLVPVWAVVGGLAAICAPPMVAALFGRRLFRLPRPMLARILAIHAGRALSTVALTALLWHLVLPGVAIGWWLVLSAMKLVLSRMPLSSNKELVFAGATALLLGHGNAIVAMTGMLAALTVMTHIAAGCALAAGEALGRRSPASALAAA